LKLEWTRNASDDLDSISEYIARDRPDAAARTILDIIRRVRILADHPEIGRRGRAANTREFVVSGLPYVVVYAIEGETVGILRVIHGAMEWPEGF
jgi:toxin ParE1/3/4